MPYFAGPIDARRLHLVQLPTHRCRTCGGWVDVAQVDATTFAEAAARLRVQLWGQHRTCEHCGSRARPELVMGDDFLVLGRLDMWW